MLEKVLDTIFLPNVYSLAIKPIAMMICSKEKMLMCKAVKTESHISYQEEKEV